MYSGLVSNDTTGMVKFLPCTRNERETEIGEGIVGEISFALSTNEALVYFEYVPLDTLSLIVGSASLVVTQSTASAGASAGFVTVM